MADGPSYARLARTYWSDPDIRALPMELSHLLIYYFSSPHGNLAGLYFLPFVYASKEAKLPIEGIVEWTTGPLRPFVTYDAESEEILVHRAARHQIGETLKAGDNRAKMIDRILRDTHSKPLVRKFLDLYRDWPVAGPPDVVAPRGPAVPPETTKPVENRGSQSPLVSPLVSPLPSLVSSSSSSQAPTKAVAVQGASEPQTDRPPTAEVEDIVSQLVVCANRGMAANPAIDQQRFRPIDTSHGSRSHVVEWLQRGIPAELIRATLDDRARSFQPSGRHFQISTMRYFESAVLDAYDKQCLTNSEAGQITVELPRSPAKRSGTLTRVDGTDPDAEAARRARLEDQAIQKWAAEHPKDEAEILEALSAEVSRDFGGGPIGGRTMELVVKSRYRTAVLARITPPLKLVKP
jgi:hypothetical protein